MLVMLCTLTWKTSASHIHTANFRSPLTIASDTTKPILKPDSLRTIINAFTDTTKLPGLPTVASAKAGKDSSVIKEKTDTFSLRLSKDSLDAPLKYKAEDSAVILVQAKKIILYGKTRTDYKD